MKTISPERAREVLSYDEFTGELTWKQRDPTTKAARIFNAKFAGRRAFTAINAYGHRHGIIDGVRLYAHRVVWAIAHGNSPAGQIDHINGDPSDNRISNLRLASHAQNVANRTGKPGTSQFKGVSLRSSGKWQAVLGKRYLGVFADEQDAATAYDAAATAAYGEFARLNFPQGATA